MKNCIVVITAILLPFSTISQSNDSTSTRPSNFGISLTQENAFGFYPVIYGSVGLSATTDLTFYGVMWTNPSFGLPVSTFSSDLWLENGFGLGFNALNGNAYINPALGFTHGKFLSGSNLDAEVYLSLYQHLRDEVTDPVNRSTADMLFYWITPGFWVNKNVSIGLHFEGLFLKFGEGDFESSYQWLGPYLKLRAKDKYDFKFMAGPNLKEGVYSKQFYKLSTNIPLN